MNRPNTLDITAALSYLDGDNWQNGNGYSGPILEDKRRPDIERLFVGRGAIAEVVNRHTSAVVGVWPRISVTTLTGETPTAQEAERIRQVNGLLTGWLDSMRLMNLLRTLVSRSLIAETALRLYVPPYQLRDGLIPAGDLATSLKRLRLSVHAPNTFKFQEDESLGTRTVAITVTTLNDGTYEEISTTDAAGNLVVTDGRTGLKSPPVPLGGRLNVAVMSRPPLVTQTMLALQRRLDLALWTEGANMELAAVTEQYAWGIRPPGTFIEREDGTEEFKPARIPKGARVFYPRESVTKEIKGADGQPAITEEPAGTANIGRFEPSSPEPIQLSQNGAYHAILREASQAHLIEASAADSSGAALRQRMADFMSSLATTSQELAWVLQEVLSAALIWAGHISGTGNPLDGLRIVVEPQVSVGEITPEERAQAIAEWKAGLRTTTSVLNLLGDQDAERTLLALDADEYRQRINRPPTPPPVQPGADQKTEEQQ